MKKEIIMTGRTVDEAVELACKELEVARENVNVEILEMSKKAFFGLKVTPAKVKVTFEKTKGDMAAEYIEEILTAMGISAQIEVENTDDGALIKLEGDDLGVIIGRRGETLDALQYLASIVANRSEGDYFRITIDSGNFREKREATLKNLAAKISAQALRTGRSVTLEPMNPYERRIIHSAVQEIEGVVSTSKGEEPHRCVVVSPTNPKKHNDRRRSDRDNRRGGYRKNSFNRGAQRRSFDDNSEANTKREAESYNDEYSEHESVPVVDNNDSPQTSLYSKIEL